jgi:serine/threonine protein kinase
MTTRFSKRKRRMSAPRSIDRQTFLSYLRHSALVAADEVARIEARHSDKPRGRSVARALVEEGVLTRFQAERLLIGRTSGFVLGPYKILDHLGRGGMGRVYKAEHRTMGRLVALKVLANEVLSSERAVQLFLHEVRAAASLVHPNIVTAYDANHAGGRYYLVLEFVDGPNLDQLVRTQGPLSPGLACDYVLQVCSALQAATQRGMIHRDIKPANILVQWHGAAGDGAPGLVKVSDFGLARLAEAPSSTGMAGAAVGTLETRDNTVMGTPDYLSPEQARCLHRTDIRSDLYSLGCTFHFLLTGQPPFPGGTALDKLIRHSTEAPPPLSKFRPDVPDAVAAIVAKLMAKKPEDRFQAPEELAVALRPFAVSGPTPWEQPRQLELAEDGGAPRSGGEPLPGDEDLSALAATLPPGLDETPRPESPSRLYRRAGAETASIQLAVITAISIIAGLMTLLGLAALLSR